MNKKAKALSLGALSFFIPFLILMLAYVALHVAPFGDKSLILSDAKAMYVADLSYLSRALRGQEDLLYSFQLGIGMNLLGTHSYLLNPANVIVLFFDITNYSTMYSLLMALDMSLCGLAMYVFLNSLNGKGGSNLIFSTVYALVGFNVANFYHYNFFLGVELLPIVALGILKIIRGKGPWVYLAALAFSIMANFYAGYILCVASVVLFFRWYAEHGKQLRAQRRRVWINYIGASLAAGMFSAVIWLPALVSLAGGRLEQNSWTDFTFVENMSLSEAGAKLFIGANNIDQNVNGFPNIFCGSLVVFLVVAFFLDERNSFKLKMVHAIPMLFYFITFYIKAFSMAMQGFSETNWFNYRYSFVFSFLMILTACEEFAHFSTLSIRGFKRACLAYLAFVLLVFSRSYSFVSGGGMLLGLAILALIIGAIYWNRIDAKRAPMRILAVLILLLCSIESYANYVICNYAVLEQWGTDTWEYEGDLLVNSALADGIAQSDGSFYRMANESATVERCNNDPRLFGYDGVNYFGSCESGFVFKGLAKLGQSWWSNRMWYGEGEPSAFDDLLGLKYIVSKRDLQAEKGYELRLDFDGNRVYLNPNALPVAVMAAPETETVTLERNPFVNHNAIWKSLTGQDRDVFIQEDDIQFTYRQSLDGTTVDYQQAKQFSMEMMAEEGDGEEKKDASPESGVNDLLSDSTRYVECSFVARRDGPIYAYTGLFVEDSNGYSLEAMRCLGTFRKGDRVADRVAVQADMTENMLKAFCAEYYAAYSDEAVLEDYCQMLIRESGSLEKLTDSRLVGTLDAKADGRLFFSIPYDEGWTLTVDGAETELEKCADLFMAAPVSSGKHSYELTFFPKGMRAGRAISCAAIVLLILLGAFDFFSKGRHIQKTKG